MPGSSHTQQQQRREEHKVTPFRPVVQTRSFPFLLHGAAVVTKSGTFKASIALRASGVSCVVGPDDLKKALHMTAHNTVARHGELKVAGSTPTVS